jgi:hypothetical protein
MIIPNDPTSKNSSGNTVQKTTVTVMIFIGSLYFVNVNIHIIMTATAAAASELAARMGFFDTTPFTADIRLSAMPVNPITLKTRMRKDNPALKNFDSTFRIMDS